MTSNTVIRALACLSFGALGVGNCAAGAAAGPAAVDTKRIEAADQEPGNWMSVGRTYDEQRYSPLKQIDENNVGKLGLAWYYDLKTQRGIEGTPDVVDGVMYATSAWNITVALDARTGKVLWRYDPKVPPEWSRFVCCDVVSRGLAVWQGKVIIATVDGRLVALDAKTGAPVWTTMTVDNKAWPYSITGAPRVFNGKVIIGNGGVELGVRGYVTAYDANTGKLIWRFWTVPGDPSKGFETPLLKKIAKETWHGKYWLQGGGGAAWDSIVYDPEFNRVYFGTGNGSPWPLQLRSEGKGDNLFLASIVALDADTGAYVWHYQMVPGESWDFDVTQPLMLADLKIEGKQRKVIMQAPKQGFFYVLDRTNGKVLSTGKFVDHNTWASSIDVKTGRPVLLPNANYSEQPRLMTPNAVAAHNWQPMSYNPNTGLVYFPVLENWYAYEIEPNYEWKKFRMSWGTNAPPSEKNAAIRAEAKTKSARGYLMAWDPVKQQEAWRVSYDKGGNGGTLTTAGNLVLEGTSEQSFVAYRATDGKKLWEADAQTVPMAGAMTYLVDGEQYIAVEAGGASFGFAQGKAQRSDGHILVYKLGGIGKLPPIPPAPPIPPPPSFTFGGTEDQVKAGMVAYHRTCAQCHGRDAISTNAMPDLRHMTPETRAQFKDIVLKGIRSAKGMQNFSDVVSDVDADDINFYLAARAREDYHK